MWNAIVGLLTNLINVMYGLTVAIGVPSYGLAIILFTVALRLVMFPLNMKQAKSTKAMSLLQPKMQKLQQQYKNSPEILNREVQALYKRYNANPLTGCLPLLIQMPILMALFSALRVFEYTGEGVSFFWLNSLSEPDPTGIVLPVIVGLSSYLQSKLMMASQPMPAGDQAKMMNMMSLYVMPVMLGWTTRSFASGLALYWCTFNILGFFMQILINKTVSRSQEEMKARIESDEARAQEESVKAEAAHRKQKEEERRRAAEKKKAKASANPPRKKNGDENKGKPLDFDDFA